MTSPLRIGVNALFLLPGRVGGTEIYVRALLNALADADRRNEYFIYRNRETGSDVVPDASNFFDRPQPVAAASRTARIAYEQFALPFVFTRDRLNVVFNGGFTAPLLTPLPMLTVFYDLQHEHFESQLSTIERLATRILFPASARRSARILMMTHTAQSEIAARYAFAKNKTLVVPHGLDQDFQAVARRRLREKPGVRPFILAVSSLRAHKNFETLLRGFAQLHRERPYLRLIVAGLRGPDAGRLELVRDALNLREAVTYTGWIPRDDLLELFATAEAFVFASRYEGFGIPVLEALTAGIPLACSDIPVLREIAGNAACYFNPAEPDGIMRSLRTLLDDEVLRERLRLAGAVRSQHFDWQRSARTLIEAFEQVGHSGGATRANGAADVSVKLSPNSPR